MYEDNNHCETDWRFTLSVFIYKIRIMVSKNPFLPVLVVPPGTRCTLKCKNCSQMCSFFPFSNEAKNIHGDFDPNEIWADIKKLLDVVKYIGVLILVGGEPFINKSLPNLMEKIINEKRIKSVLFITNGTVPHKMT